MSVHVGYGSVTRGVEIFTNVEACQGPDRNSDPDDKIYLSYIHLLVMDYFSPTSAIFEPQIGLSYKTRNFQSLTSPVCLSGLKTDVKRVCTLKIVRKHSLLTILLFRGQN